jgi:hypothetical protein
VREVLQIFQALLATTSDSGRASDFVDELVHPVYVFILGWLLQAQVDSEDEQCCIVQTLILIFGTSIVVHCFGDYVT